MIVFIAAMDARGTIGKQNRMPWNCPKELQQFKEITWNHTILMGRITFEHLPKRLENRHILVLTHETEVENPLAQSMEIIHSVQDVVNVWSQCKEHLYICGGAQIYKLFLPYMDAFYLSIMKKTYEGDTMFPTFSLTSYTLLEKVEYEDYTRYHYCKHKHV